MDDQSVIQHDDTSAAQAAATQQTEGSSGAQAVAGAQTDGAAGTSIPSPLCAVLAPTLKGREFLTEPELAVYWYAQERRRIPLVIAVRPNLTSLAPDAKLLTADGYRAELFRDDGGAAIAMKVTAPRRHMSKPRLSLVA